MAGSSAAHLVSLPQQELFLDELVGHHAHLQPVRLLLLLCWLSAWLLLRLLLLLMLCVRSVCPALAACLLLVMLLHRHILLLLHACLLLLHISAVLLQDVYMALCGCCMHAWQCLCGAC